MIKRLFGLWLLGLLAACTSTQPPATRNRGASLPTGTSIPSAALATLSATSTPTTLRTSSPTPAAPIAENNGPATPIMAELQISGERYATLGDPAAPITVIEFSDFG